MKEVKSNFRFSDPSKASLNFLQELEHREEFECPMRRVCMGFSGEEIPQDNCWGVASDNGCGYHSGHGGNNGYGCGIDGFPRGGNNNPGGHGCGIDGFSHGGNNNPGGHGCGIDGFPQGGNNNPGGHGCGIDGFPNLGGLFNAIGGMLNGIFGGRGQ